MGSSIISIISQAWIGTVLGLLGLLSAYYFFRKSMRRSQLAVQHSEVAIVGGGSTAFPSDLQILFGNRVVPRVTATSIILWNSGTDTIDGSQILPIDHLRVEVSEGEIVLQANVLTTTRTVNGIEVQLNSSCPNVADIYFAYLDPGDGAAIEILHTDSGKKLSVKGTIKSIPKGITNLGAVSIDKTLSHRAIFIRRFKLSAIIALTGVMGMVMTGLLYSISPSDGSPQAKVVQICILVMAACTIGYLFVALREGLRASKRYPIVLAPQAVVATANPVDVDTKSEESDNQ